MAEPEEAHVRVQEHDARAVHGDIVVPDQREHGQRHGHHRLDVRAAVLLSGP